MIVEARWSLFVLAVFNIFLLSSAAFRVKFDTIHECDNIPKGKYDDEFRIVADIRVKTNKRNETTLSGVFFVKKKTSPLNMSIRVYEVEDSKTHLLFNIEKLKCNNPVNRMIVSKFRPRFNSDCSANYGNYTMGHIKVCEVVQQFQYATKDPGEYLLEYIILTEKGMVSCSFIRMFIIKDEEVKKNTPRKDTRGR